MAFPREQRLRESRLIQMVLKKGARKQTPFFRVHSLPSFSGQTQVAVIVSTKIESTAVKRNRIRRRIQAAVWTVLEENSKNIKPQLLVFLGNTNVLEGDFEEIKKEVQKTLQNNF